jgi:hypothetical protein
MKLLIAICLFGFSTNNYNDYTFSVDDMMLIANQTHLHQVGYSMTEELDSIYDLTKTPIQEIEKRKNEIVQYYQDIKDRDSSILKDMLSYSFTSRVTIDSLVNPFPDDLCVVFCYNNASEFDFDVLVDRKMPHYRATAYYIFTKNGELINLVEFEEKDALQYICKNVLETDSYIKDTRKLIEIYTKWSKYGGRLVDSSFAVKLETEGVHAPLEEMRGDHLFLSMCFYNGLINKVSYYIYEDGRLEIEYETFETSL